MQGVGTVVGGLFRLDVRFWALVQKYVLSCLTVSHTGGRKLLQGE